MTQYELAVNRGIEFLDTHIPGWEDDIDMEKLNMSSQCNCVVGQLLGFYRALHTVFPHAAKGSYYGFDIPTDVSFNQLPFVDNLWGALEDVWKERINAKVANKEQLVKV